MSKQKEDKQEKIVITYNRGDGTAYVYLRKKLKDMEPGEVKDTTVLEPIDDDKKSKFKPEIIVDTDEEGRVVGIEILGDVMPKNLD